MRQRPECFVSQTSFQLSSICTLSCNSFTHNYYYTQKIKIYMIVILPVILYGCETWYLTLREEHRLRVFENRVLKRIFGPWRQEVTGGWGKLHNDVF